MTPAQNDEMVALAEILCEIFLSQEQPSSEPAPSAEFDTITDSTLTSKIKLLQ
jgi:hypothetical protein